VVVERGGGRSGGGRSGGRRRGGRSGGGVCERERKSGESERKRKTNIKYGQYPIVIDKLYFQNLPLESISKAPTYLQ